MKIQTGYPISPYFKDLYLYLAQNKLPSTKSAIQKEETLAEKIYLIRFPIIQTSNHTQEGDSTVSNSQSLCS